MYCSSCGVATTPGLNFCNYCGAKLLSPDSSSESREVRPQFIVSAMAGVFVLGLPGIAFIIFMLNAALHLDTGQTMAFAWTILFLLMALEAVFLMLLLVRRESIRARFGVLSGAFLVGYAVARSSCEIFRQPDVFLGYLIGSVTMGQLLCIPMLIAGGWLILRRR